MTAIETSEGNIVQQIMDRLGPCTLLKIPSGKKGPITPDWPKLTQADMTAEYLAELNHGGNIGVSLGKASDGLCTVDCDTDVFLELFLSTNPGLQESLISKGMRGGNVWFRIKREYPPNASLKLNGEKCGEWRADKLQTVIHGRHPSGCDYSNNGKRPLFIEFEDIKWPDGLYAPWIPKKHSGREEFFILPSGVVGICESARGIFSFIAPTHTLFARAGGITEAAPADDGHLYLRPITPIAFCSRLEGYGRRVAAWRASGSGDGTFVLKLSQCSVDTSAKLLETLEAEELLPRIRTIVAAPLLA